MKKRLTALFLAFALIFALLPAAVLTASAETYSGTCGAEGDGSNLTWTLDTETGVLTISGAGEMTSYSNKSFVPWYSYRNAIKTVIIGSGMTSIGSYAFCEHTGLTSVTIPDSVTSIGEFAFAGCNGLTSVTIPGGVKSINKSVFSLCSGLTSVMIPDSVTIIDDAAFYACYGLTSITIPDSVTIIGKNAFYYCTGLTSVTIGSGVISIDSSAFYECTGLTSIAIPDNVMRIGDEAFEFCNGLTSVIIENDATSIGESVFYGTAYFEDTSNWTDDVLYVGNHLIKAQESISGTHAIKEGTGTIADGAFRYCNELTSVTIPDSVTIIGKEAFRCCHKLTSITIPDSVTSIGSAAFNDCFELKNLTIGSGLPSISSNAFSRCIGLTSITIPNSVMSIGESAFSNCTGLTSVTIPDSVTSIGESAFRDCTGLTSVTIPNSVTSIGNWAFGYNCNETSYIITKIGSFTIYGYKGSAAQAYAIENKLHFVNMETGLTVFFDVQETSYYAPAVDWAVANQVTNGTSATTFSPDDTCTRGQVVTFLWRAMGSPAPKSTENPFSDIKPDDYFYNAVLWAKEKGITSGTTPTTFSPNDGCTRAQVVTFLWRTEGEPKPTSPNNPFKDVTGGYYYDAVLWAVEKGITKGTSATEFSPDDTCTRGQIVTFLYRDLA